MTLDSLREKTIAYWRNEAVLCMESARRELDAGA